MAYNRYVPEFTDKDGNVYGVMDGEAREQLGALIDDTAGAGDRTKVWSADKSATEQQSVLSAINVLDEEIFDVATIVYPNIMVLAEQKVGYIKDDGTINTAGTAVYASLPVSRNINEHVSISFPNSSATIPNTYKTFVLAFYNGSTLVSYVTYANSVSQYKYENHWYLTAEIPANVDRILFTLKVGTTDFTSGTLASYGLYIDSSEPYVSKVKGYDVVNETQKATLIQLNGRVSDIEATALTQSDMLVYYPDLMLIAEQKEGYIQSDGTINTATGTVYAEIPVSRLGNQYISICFPVSSTQMSGSFNTFVLAFYNGSSLVSYVTYPNSKSANTYDGKWYLTTEIPSTADKVLFTLKVGTVDFTSGTIASYGTLITPGNPYILSIKNYVIRNTEIDALLKFARLHSNLTGKKMTVIGDSITYVSQWAKINWHKWISDWTGCTVQNLGRNGTGFMRNDPYIDRIQNIDSDTDIIGIAASLNDCDFNIGTVDDTTEDNTALGYANDFFDALLLAFPNTPIICYVQNPWDNRHFGVQRSDDFVTGVQTICHRKGIPFYGDMYLNGSVLKPWIASNCDEYFTNDSGTVNGAHPNDKGHLVIANYLLDKFEQNVVNHFVVPWQAV